MMNDLTELLVDSMTLLMNDNSEDTKRNVGRIVTLIDDPKNNKGNKQAFQDVALTKTLASIVNELLNKEDSTSKSEQAEILVKFATNPVLAQNPEIREGIKTIFTETEKFTDTKLERLQFKIRNNITWHTLNDVSRSMFTKLNKASDTTDEQQREYILDDLINTAKSMLETEDRKISTASDAVERIVFSDIETIIPAVDKFKEAEYTGILKTPLQGFNMMCGKRGGIALGESVNINGISGMFKSGLLTLLGEGIVRYNTPPASIIAQGTPLILFISCENEANKNMMKWFKEAYARVYHKWPENVNKMDSKDVAKFIQDTYASCGYKFIIERRQASTFGFDEFQKAIEEYEILGYRVVCVVVDYLKKMKLMSKLLVGASSRKEDSLINFLFEQMCGYCKTKGITFITANQLNREAIAIANSTQQNIVKRFGSHLTGSALGALQEVDLNIFIHLEYNQYKTRFLTVLRDKHRHVDDTPLAHQYFAYPFTEFGILPDVEGEPQFVRDIYAVAPPEGYMEDDTSNGDSGGMGMF